MTIIINEDQLFDLRLVERHIQKGRASKKEFAKYLKELEDVEENADYITADLIFDELKKEEDEEEEE